MENISLSESVESGLDTNLNKIRLNPLIDIVERPSVKPGKMTIGAFSHSILDTY